MFPRYFLGGSERVQGNGRKGKKGNIFSCGSHEEYSGTQDRAGSSYKELSVKRSWMPEEAIVSDQIEKLCLSH